jgi:hypothetical protein
MTLSKKEAQRRHAARRAAERYFLHLTASVRDEIIRTIQSGRSTHLGRASLRVSKHRVKLHDGLTVTVVYDNKRKEIVTFLPNDRSLADEQMRTVPRA